MNGRPGTAASGLIKPSAPMTDWHELMQIYKKAEGGGKKGLVFMSDKWPLIAEQHTGWDIWLQDAFSLDPEEPKGGQGGVGGRGGESGPYFRALVVDEMQVNQSRQTRWYFLRRSDPISGVLCRAASPSSALDRRQ
ncbi:unnamed protein product [Pleuronectes platessa]|uniref:Uncharacterized protein n=1 Tax=Pleuronectes platessa TaxID=8262 RepID=A0A9N7YVD8_PLEPL|nr:unnamed protein product [Pleuronectes platessa]